MKKVLHLMVFSLLFCVSLLLFNPTNVFASTGTTLENQLISYTDSDEFVFNNTTYTIQDYKNSINNDSLFGSTMDFGTTYYTVYSDDPIVKIIPKEYFYNVGVETYIGKEYGFFIETVSETYYDGYYSDNSENYRSYVIVFDINNDTDLESNVDRAIFKVTNLFCLEFITINQDELYCWRKEDAMATEYLNDYLDYSLANDVYYESSDEYCVVPLYDLNDNAKTNRYYLNDISFAGQLQNEQAYNSNDYGYVANQDTGSYFTRLDYIYDGKYIVDGSWADVDYGAIAGIIADNLIDTALSYIPYVGDALSTIYGATTDGIEILQILDEGLSDKEYDISNDSYVTQAYYVNRDDQIYHYGYLTKCAYFALNTDSDLSILYEENDYAKIEYTIGHSALGEEADLTRMTSEIALKIVDRDCNMIACATSVNNFSLREPVYEELTLGQNNKMFLLDKGTNYFSFSPNYSGKYVINIDSPNGLKVDFDSMTQQGNTLSIERNLIKGRQYYLKIENIDNDRLCLEFELDISNNLNNITVNKNDSFIVKLDTLDGFNKMSFNNLNCKLSLLSDDFVLIKNSESNSLSYYFDNDANYMLIKNDSSSSVTNNVLVTYSFENIYLDSSKEVALNKGENFYKFTPSTSGTYSVVVFEQNTSTYNFEIYSEYGEPIVTSIFCNGYTIYECHMSAGGSYYIGYENCTISQGKLDISIKTKNNVFTFYVDEEEVNGPVYLEQGQEFTLVVKMNDLVVQNIQIYSFSGREDSYVSVKNSRSSGTSDGITYVVSNDAPTSNAYCDVLAVVSTENAQIEYISLIYLPKFTIEIENYSEVNTNTPNQLKWYFTSSNERNTADVKVQLKFLDNSTKIINFSVDSSEGFASLPALDEIITTYGKQKAIAEAKIIQVVFHHDWGVEGDDGDDYHHTFTNSYPNEPNLEEKEFYLEPITVNMMFNGGNGTSYNPYLIVNEWQLNNIRLCDSEYREGAESYKYIQSYFAIVNDITLTEEWRPIDTPIRSGKIYGYENNKKTIYNLEISESKAKLDIGFVRCLYGGSIEYLNFKNAKVNVSNSTDNEIVSIGIIAGTASGGSIRNCSIESDSSVKVGNINDSTDKKGAKYTFTGGICGLGNTIYSCTNAASVSSYGDVGGIAGYVLAGIISNCTNSGKIELLHNNVDLSNDDENKAIGGILGVAYGVDFVSVSNTGSINYVSKEKCTDKELAPRMGNLAGDVLNSTLNGVDITSVGSSSSNVQTGNLQTKNGFLGIGKYDQKKYAGHEYGIVE